MHAHFFDTHTHLSTHAFSEDLSQVLARSREALVTHFIAIGSGDGIEGNHKALEFAQKEAATWATIGIHPHDAQLWTETLGQEFKMLAQREKKFVAWGEIGLDYHYMHASKEVQEKAFVAQIELAHWIGFPIVIHTREAEEDTLAILTKYRDRIHRLCVHCFTGDQKFASALLDLDAYLGVGGVATFRNAEPIRDALRGYPLNRLLLETDCPYLAPVPFRGKRNEPAYIPHIAKLLAELKEVSVEELARQTSENAAHFFALSSPKA